ncbi:hypothetical protein AVEN_56251-1 [Araneus ventricosus]|uniref:Uncharacterized protein n=1 Tax=Araneus ventricosus TaxID=182803 RepID=A0A4Y2M671_ARAVE|nr:hypothetical protein AVEN_56251-1 [Araneus ventricosus]
MCIQHDDAPIPTSNATKIFKLENVIVLEWPPMISDQTQLKMWGIMSPEGIENGGQFYSVNALKTANESVWYNLEPEILQTLIMSMEKHVYNVILRNGKTLNY